MVLVFIKTNISSYAIHKLPTANIYHTESDSVRKSR